MNEVESLRPRLRLSHSEAHIERRDALARIIAAEKMSLLRDPTGERLPDEIWQQATPIAEALFLLIRLLKGPTG